MSAHSFRDDDMSFLPPEIQARLMRPEVPLPPMPEPFGQAPVAETAPTLAPGDQPGGSFMDRLAMILSQVDLPQATRPQGAFGQNLIAAAAKGFAGTRMADIGQRREGARNASEAARTLNAHRWSAYEKQQGQRIKFLQDQSAEMRKREAESPEAKKAAAKATREGTLEADKAAGAGAFNPRASMGLFGQPGVDDVAQSIADAIESGTQAPVTTGLYRYGGPVRAELARRGYDLQRAGIDFQATTRWMASANSTQQLRLRQAAETAYGSLDIVDQLSAELSKIMPRGQVRVLNRAALNLAQNGTFGVQAQQVATQLDAQITDIVSELGNVYMGGNSPTDHSLQLAAKNLRSDWSLPQLRAATDLARKNLRIRLNSIGTAGPISPSNPITSEPSGTIQVGGRKILMAPPQAGTPGASALGGASSTVRMIAPDGSFRDVPADQVEHFKARGARVAP